MISEKSSSDYSKGVRMRKFLVTLILVSTVISCSKDDGMDDNILNGTYAKKFNIIHYKTNPMYDVDKKTFEILSFDYAKDNEHIYFGNKIIAGADIESFVLVGDYMSKDKKSCILPGNDSGGSRSGNIFCNRRGDSEIFFRQKKNIQQRRKTFEY